MGDTTLLVGAALTSTIDPLDKEKLDLILPMPEQQLLRMLNRAGFETTRDFTVDLDCMELPPEVNEILEKCPDDLVEINSLCQTVLPMNGKQLEKLAAAVLLAEPEGVSEVRRLAENLDQFDFIPDIHNATEYGKYMIQSSGHFDYDENLADFYDYRGYGEQRIALEGGKFNELGYVYYTGTLALDKLMKEDPATAQETEKREHHPAKHKRRHRSEER